MGSLPDLIEREELRDMTIGIKKSRELRNKIAQAGGFKDHAEAVAYYKNKKEEEIMTNSMVQGTENRQVNRLELERRIAQIRGILQIAGVGSWREESKEEGEEFGDVRIGTGGTTIFDATYVGKVFDQDTWRVKEMSFYPVGDPCTKAYPGVDRGEQMIIEVEDNGEEISEDVEVDNSGFPESGLVNSYRCSGFRVCGNEGCMSHDPHDYNEGIDKLMNCPVIGRDVEGLLWNQDAGRFYDRIGKMKAALQVLTLDKTVRAFLEQNDPMALRQALRALGEPDPKIPPRKPKTVKFFSYGEEPKETPVEEVQVPDLWHIATWLEGVKEDQRIRSDQVKALHDYGAQILEAWHLCHTLLKNIRES